MEPASRKSTYTRSKCRRRSLVFIEIALYVIGIGLLIQVLFVRNSLTKTFDSEAANRLIISPSTQSSNSTIYRNWLSNTCDDVCAIQLFNYYLFNITNPDDVLTGSYPTLQQLGPFVFNRYEIRNDVNFSADGRVAHYRYEYEYVLNEEMTNMTLWNRSTWTAASNTTASYPSIYVLNPFMMAAIASCKQSGGGLVSSCSALTDANKLFFSNYTPQQILATGMESQSTAFCERNPLCNLTQKYILDDDVYVSEYTGVDDTNRMRELITFYEPNQTFLSYWDGNECFAGTREPKQWLYDSITEQSRLSTWMMDKYRRVQLVHDGYTQLSDLRLDKFVIDPKEYLSAENNTNNTKYYQFGYDGLLNLTTTNGADIAQFNTKPFFLDAPYYQQQLNMKMGLRAPNRSIDDSYFLIDSKLGTVFEARLAYQVSFGIEPCTSCGRGNSRPFAQLPTLLLPQFYVVLNAEAPPKAIEQYKQILALLDTTTQYSIYIAPVLALCSILFAVILSGRRWRTHRKRVRNKMTLYMHDYDSGNKHISAMQLKQMKQEDATNSDAWHDSVGYAQRDEDDPMQSIDKAAFGKANGKKKMKIKTQASTSSLTRLMPSQMYSYS